MTRTLIIGTGDMAHALCHMYKNHNFKPHEHCLAVTKPGLGRKLLQRLPAFHDTGVPFVHLDESIHISDIIILAIPATAIKAFLGKYFVSMKNKIIVDVTNSIVRGEDLQAMLGLTETRWVKAFNDNGAVDLLLDKPYGKKQVTTSMCGSNLEAVYEVKHFAEEALGFTVKIVPNEQYQDIAMHQNSLGDDWVTSAKVILFLFALCEIYAVLRYNVSKGYEWFHLPMQVTNKAICWTALNAFALTMFPGLLARFIDVLYENKMMDKPKCIIAGLRIRKPLGLLALWFLGLHIIMSLLLFNPNYYGKFFLDPAANSSKLNAVGESSIFFAILGTGFYCILGVCSLPSVGNQMTSRSWQLVYGPLAWTALLFGTIHVLIMGVKGWDEQEGWPGGLPPITLTSVLLPMAVMFLKICQIATKYTIRSFFTQKRAIPSGNSYLAEAAATPEMLENGHHSSSKALIQHNRTGGEGSSDEQEATTNYSSNVPGLSTSGSRNGNGHGHGHGDGDDNHGLRFSSSKRKSFKDDISLKLASGGPY